MSLQYHEKLLLLRRQHGYTQKQLAQMSGVHENTISLLELGERDLYVRTLKLLCKVYHCTLSEFFQGVE